MTPHEVKAILSQVPDVEIATFALPTGYDPEA
jgi:hypothetical protein